jgi:hypothetical protein
VGGDGIVNYRVSHDKGARAVGCVETCTVCDVTECACENVLSCQNGESIAAGGEKPIDQSHGKISVER